MDRVEEPPHELEDDAAPVAAAEAFDTPIKSPTAKPKHERRLTITPKSAMSSLRQHIPRHTLTARTKHGSLNNIPFRRPSSDSSNGMFGSDRVAASPADSEEGNVLHKRSISLAGSLVGSIRGLGRKNVSTSCKVPSPMKETSPERPAENVPLPSSPIDIPSVAPALELDLGPRGFMAGAFDASPKKAPFLPANAVPVPNPVTARPNAEHVPTRADTSEESSFGRRPVTPSDILQLSSSYLGEIPPANPAMPMPGTNLQLEVDGANGGGPSVFERSVTPRTEKERKS